MIADLFQLLAAILGFLGFIGLTTYYSMDRDTKRTIRKSMRALDNRRYFRVEHVVYFVVKLGQNRKALLLAFCGCYMGYLIFKMMGV